MTRDGSRGQKSTLLKWKRNSYSGGCGSSWSWFSISSGKLMWSSLKTQYKNLYSLTHSSLCLGQGSIGLNVKWRRFPLLFSAKCFRNLLFTTFVFNILFMWLQFGIQEDSNSIEILPFKHKHTLVYQTELLFVQGVSNVEENESACASVSPHRWTKI